MQKFIAFLKQETVLCVAVVLGVISSLFYTPKLSYIDFEVLGVLLSLMLVVAGLKSIHFLDWVAVELLNKCQSFRAIGFALVAVTYISSMFVTNDVALITFVPLALIIGRKIGMDMDKVIILQTLAANLGSMLTPPGNPQNLFLFSHYGYTAGSFFRVMLVPTALAVLYLGILVWRLSSKGLNLTLDALEKPSTRLTVIYLGLLFLNIAAVLRVVDKFVALGITAMAVLLLQKKLFKQVDYSLLVTFVGFFIFVGNISHSPWVGYLQQFLGSWQGTYLAALVSSQFISNVPAAMLLAGFTNQADALLLGVNVGGLGTLIASMASVISYKLYVAEYPGCMRAYLARFFLLNFVGLFLIGAATWLIFA